MLPRGFQSCKDKNIKSTLLGIVWAMPAAKALTRPGDPAKRQDGASELFIGAMLGQDRSTTNRHLAKFSATRCGVCYGKKEIPSEVPGQKEPCPKCHGEGTRDAEVVELLHKWRPGIGCVNRYAYVEKAQKVTDEKKKHHIFNHWNPDKLAERYGEDLFDRNMEGVDGCGPVKAWWFSPHLKKAIRCECRKGQMKFNFSSHCQKCGGKGSTIHPTKKIGPSARNVGVVLDLKGLGTLREFLEMTNAEIGELAGLSENTVSKALDQWEDHKILQIVPGKVIYEDFLDPKTGKPAIKCREPQRIIWLPGLLLDPQIIERERQRFAAHLEACRELAKLNGWARAGVHMDRIKALHAELLRRWFMSRHSLGAFWNAMRKVIYREGIPSGSREDDFVDYRDELFPLSLFYSPPHIE